MENKPIIEKLKKAVEAKTGEEVIAVSGHIRTHKKSTWQKLKCWIGFHEFDQKNGEGYFTDNQCSHCLTFKN